MTAITALITRVCTAHAVDSLVTVETDKDKFTPMIGISRRSSAVEGEFWGAMSFWGYAKADCPKYKWSTPDWRRAQARSVGKKSAEEFANHLAIDLQSELNKVKFVDKDGNERAYRKKGIGIHFTAYENIKGVWVPELFLITNWNSLPYTSIDANKVHVSRETYSVLERAMNKGVMKTSPATHGSESCRLFVHQYLHASDSNWFIFNNGDPAMFNSFAGGIHNGFRILSNRGALKGKESADTYRNLAELPILLIAETQSRFCTDNSQLVGGRVHSLSIQAGREYRSETGELISGMFCDLVRTTKPLQIRSNGHNAGV